MQLLEGIEYDQELPAYISKEHIRSTINKYFWTWYEAGGKYQKITTLTLFKIIRKTIYVKDIRDIFVLLFGPQNGLLETD